MPWIGLTGVFGAGKSQVLAIFREEGAAVLDADDVVRELEQPGSPVLGRIVSLFGPSVLRPDGSLDRPRVADIVFRDLEARRRLENVLHPEVFLHAEAFRDRIYREQGDRLVVFEAPLLFESGYDATMDGVAVVICGMERIMERSLARGLSRGEVLRRIAAQLPQEEKQARADWVIDNSGNAEDTRRRVREVVEAIRSRFPGA